MLADREYYRQFAIRNGTPAARAIATRILADEAYAAAIVALQRQPDAAPALARTYRHYGKFLKRLGRAEAALEAFELAADLAPSNQDALAPLPTADIRSPSDR